ncbi:DNA-binding transcriptional regulator, FadR family [Paucidesulfovibrio gracilis DSM 16080]|uniref:DNA-binding transcriptional regulator, FadR family n=1 Tax=Paucidesulfovibrio gracilis DSM 16080 TaxID=1121449 RepID=A0A1T4Y382_9BACT|nr:FadR/GntR family transcriptional regulator [Paucidesulfovibrio gracilis]SKA96206.1 DNA-binding transcriptional regulator, FadR family [Paucidesulfovibrio gracilis DSM 16080]
MTVTKFDTPVIGKRQTLPEELAGIIMRQIEGGDFKPGDVLPSEQSLANTFNVSRTVVREALARLKFEGVIESKRGSGPVVRGIDARKTFTLPSAFSSKSERAQIIEFRLIMEGESAALAAARRTQEQVDVLRDYLENMRLAIENKTSGLVPDYRFHCLIAEAAHNEYITSFIKFLSSKMLGGVQEARSLSNKDLKRASMVLEEHSVIYDAILRQSPEDARAAVYAHLMSSAKRQGIELTGPLRYSTDD